MKRISNFVCNEKGFLLVFFFLFFSQIVAAQSKPQLIDQKIIACDYKCLKKNVILSKEFKNNLLYLTVNIYGDCNGADSLKLEGLFGDTLKFYTKIPYRIPVFSAGGYAIRYLPYFGSACACYNLYHLTVSNLTTDPHVIFVDGNFNFPDSSLKNFEWYMKLKTKFWSNNTNGLEFESWDKLIDKNIEDEIFRDVCKKLGKDSVVDCRRNFVDYSYDGVLFVVKDSVITGLYLNTDSFRGNFPFRLQENMTESEITKVLGKPDSNEVFSRDNEDVRKMLYYQDRKLRILVSNSGIIYLKIGQ